MSKSPNSQIDIEAIKKRIRIPKRAVVTAGMPYASGPMHLGHLAGAQVPADIYSRWLGMLIGRENVLFVCGSDDHGSTSELAALQAGKPIRQFIDELHAQQERTMSRYAIGLDVYTGTSRPECFPIHKEISQNFLRSLHRNGMLKKQNSRHWYDPKLNRFLQDRFVRGRCPNSKCENTDAYSDECEDCGTKYQATDLLNPRSMLSDATPVLKESVHWWLDIWKVSEPLRMWLATKQKFWRTPVINEVYPVVLPSLQFSNAHEPKYKEIKENLPKHKSRYAPGKRIVLQFENKEDLSLGQATLDSNAIESQVMDQWAHRSISRDVAWGIPMPADLDPDMAGKTLYVWPDSLIAPISFSKVALLKKGEDGERYREFWQDPLSAIYQFLGQDNVFFYVLMQGALWLGSQKDPLRLPEKGDLQLTEVFGCFHLMVDGKKMSKSKGNFFTADQMLDEKGYSSEQLRYFLALLSLPEKPSNFDFHTFEERNRFLAGPLNAALEKPISACHSKFDGLIPEGTLSEKVLNETSRIIERYFRSMERAEFSTLLFAIENYARTINSLFTQFKPHDDRFPELERRNALFSCFFVLKNLMIMLYPFAPETMDKLRQSLLLPPEVFTVNELGVAIPAGHRIGQKQQFFPAVPAAES